MATRHSPRSVERICYGIQLPGITSEHLATLFALAHCTGWTAERIALKFKEVAGVELTAEQIWSLHNSWVTRRGGDYLDLLDAELLRFLLCRIRVDISAFRTPLNRTQIPKTVKFAARWSPMDPPNRPLFAGFTIETRERSKAYLSLVSNHADYCEWTPVEEGLVKEFGSVVTTIMKEVMKEWANALWAKLQQHSTLRRIFESEHSKLIMEYLCIFEEEYEYAFGEMEESPADEIVNAVVKIRSTGFGAKIFLGLIMADRVHAISDRHERERLQIGFEVLDPSTLADSSKDCPVCQDPMGVENSEGTKEAAIKLITCCGQVVGHRCLKTWLGEYIYGNIHRDTCPLCRFKFPQHFVQKLFSNEERLARYTKQNEVGDD